MEDELEIRLALRGSGGGGERVSMFAIFDGHGGAEAAKFLRERLGNALGDLDDPCDPEAIIATVHRLDREFCSDGKVHNDSGSTACVVLVQHADQAEADMARINATKSASPLRPVPRPAFRAITPVKRSANHNTHDVGSVASSSGSLTPARADTPSQPVTRPETPTTASRPASRPRDTGASPILARGETASGGATSGSLENGDTAVVLRPNAQRSALRSITSSNTDSRRVHSSMSTVGPQLYKLTVINVGDSRAILLRGGPGASVEQLTIDHTPNLPEERKRIQSAGAYVKEKGGIHRVNNELAISRTFGDPRFKRADGKGQAEQAVVSTPQITVAYAHEGDTLMLSCDGVYETMDVGHVADWLRSSLLHGQNDTRVKDQSDGKRRESIIRNGPPRSAAVALARLLDYSLYRGSRDNQSAILVRFGVPPSHISCTWSRRGRDRDTSRPVQRFVSGHYSSYRSAENPNYFRNRRRDMFVKSIRDHAAGFGVLPRNDNLQSKRLESTGEMLAGVFRMYGPETKFLVIMTVLDYLIDCWYDQKRAIEIPLLDNKKSPEKVKRAHFSVRGERPIEGSCCAVM